VAFSIAAPPGGDAPSVLQPSHPPSLPSSLEDRVERVLLFAGSGGVGGVACAVPSSTGVVLVGDSLPATAAL